MTARYLIAILFSCCSVLQASDSIYFFVSFTDKDESVSEFSHPAEFLSERSLERRVRYQIPVDIKDYPIPSSYIDSILLFDITLAGKSKWLNGILIQSADTALADTLSQYSFVKTVAYVDKITQGKSFFDDKDPLQPVGEDHLTDEDNRQLVNGIYLHDEGYRGSGVYIAVLDGGFINVDSLDIYTTEIHGVYDYVDDKKMLFDASSHGTKVLSLMATDKEDFIKGTAPDAIYFLYKTEDVHIESRIEEFFWIFAAENADSLGVDVINTSLGYSWFDNTEVNYTYDDMDGMTAYISVASSVAASRGIFLVTSAGNKGNKDWKHITAPADAHGILSIGAVGYDGSIASFSSYGPSADGRVKPELVAPGNKVRIIDENGDHGYGNGTSYSAPVMAGMLACLLQKYPATHPQDIRQALIQSADRFENPHECYGYGIPDVREADRILAFQSRREKSRSPVLIFPNPANTVLKISIKNSVTGDDVIIKIIDTQGKIVDEKKFTSIEKTEDNLFSVSVKNIPSGAYLCHVITGDFSEVTKIIINPD